jgi:hypothetical protein
MQGKNSTRSMQPKSVDGTQDFSMDHLGHGGRHGPVSAAEPELPRTSEGSKVDADSGRGLLTPERSDERPGPQSLRRPRDYEPQP